MRKVEIKVSTKPLRGHSQGGWGGEEAEETFSLNLLQDKQKGFEL